jgi:pimeloyl-ACP methyl ester carboxylesterase
MRCSEIQLILFPPIGADHRIFYPQEQIACKVVSVPPIEWRGGETIKGHSSRLFDRLKRDGLVDFSQPAVFGGLSLGGAIAQEMSLLHKPLGLILMGSFTSANEINPIVRMVCASSKLIPLGTYELAVHVVPHIMRTLGYLKRTDIELMNTMFREFDKRSFRNALGAIGKWHGVSREFAVPTLRIHGRKDPIIPRFSVQSVDHWLDTQHLLSLGKPDEVNSLISNFMSRLPGCSF